MKHIYRLPINDDYMDSRKDYHSNIIKVIANLDTTKVLDIGERNPLAAKMERDLGVVINNTTGDLDYGIKCQWNKYTLIVCSHVIEHLMNPLLLLNNIRSLLAKDGRLLIAYPISIIKSKCHFHEIPIEDFKFMVDKAGFEIVSWKEYRVKPKLSGIRPILRAIYDRNHIIVLKLRHI